MGEASTTDFFLAYNRNGSLGMRLGTVVTEGSSILKKGEIWGVLVLQL